jgi:hypothetical protein
MDVTIKGIPEGAEKDIKEMAAVGVRRFLEKTELQIDEVKVANFNTKMNEFLRANELLPKEEPEQLKEI